MKSASSRARRRVAEAAAAVALFSIGVTGCGGGDEDSASSKSGSEAQRAAALSLKQAMDASGRTIDGVRGTRDSVERVGASLKPQIAQTSDVIAVLTPTALKSDLDRMMLDAAREQRSFLQFSADATTSRSRKAARSAISRAREVGRRASGAYEEIARTDSAMAALLPSSTSFNTGRLRDAVLKATAKRGASGAKPAGTPAAPAGGGSAGASSCGDGVSVNSVTSCPFGRNVREAYEESGGASTVEVYSPVTGETYTMRCSSGMPTVCTGGNGAAVYIR